MMLLTLIISLVLTGLLPNTSAGKDRLEKIRLLHEHDGIDTATVHISYPHSPALRRLTKREAAENLASRQHDNVTVKVTLSSSGRVLDLQLQPSKLQFHGALVTEMHAEGRKEEHAVQDEGCHYQGFFDDRLGIVSVHFCDGILVGAAHNGHTEYSFHSPHHPLPDEDSSGTMPDLSKDLGLPDHEESVHHTLVSWKDASKDFVKEPVEESEREEERSRRKRQADSEQYGIEGDLAVAPMTPEDADQNVEVNISGTPVAEFGIILDEDFLRDTKYYLPTRQHIVNYLMSKFTGVQALYGNYALTGINVIIQIKLVYLWYKNPSWYPGNTIPLGRRMGAGANFSREPEGALYKLTDVGALFTSNASRKLGGMGLIGGGCKWKSKTFVTRNSGLNWIVEAHEFGHELGLGHVPVGCKEAPPPFNTGFMASFRQMLPPCYAVNLKNHLRSSRLKCLYQENVTSHNVPPLQLKPTFPVLSFGLDYQCGAFFREDAVFVTQEDKVCGNVLCAVLDESRDDYSMAQITPGGDASLFGRSCGPNGEICMGTQCVNPRNYTTINAVDTVTGTGRWQKWPRYARACSSACGVGVQISTRKCNKPRVEACSGPRFRAKLCKTQSCPGDDLKTELELRKDRADYTCGLLKARNSSISHFLEPFALRISGGALKQPISFSDSCLVKCATSSAKEKGVRYQRKAFGTVILSDGTLCGPVNNFDRHMLGVTTRCLRGSCIEFDCKGNSMESRDRGKVKDMCGRCGGRNTGCTAGEATVLLQQDEVKEIAEMPAGTRNIQFAVHHVTPVQGDDTNNDKPNTVVLVLVDKDNNEVVTANLRDPLYKATINNEKNPLHFAGTYWTNWEYTILTAPGPIDQPVKIKVQSMGSNLAPVNAKVVWGYKPLKRVPSPPPCENNGVANVTNGGCMCVEPQTYGSQCENTCGGLCLNGGVMDTSRCRDCDCTANPRAQGDSHCACAEGFAGPDCSQCAIQQCYHGGVLDNDTCQCNCSANCSAADCSDCNYNPLLPHYKGHYGRGSLEDFFKNPDKRDDQSTPPTDDQKTTDGKRGPITDGSVGGQSSVHRHACLVPALLAARVITRDLQGFPLF